MKNVAKPVNNSRNLPTWAVNVIRSTVRMGMDAKRMQSDYAHGVAWAYIVTAKRIAFTHKMECL